MNANIVIVSLVIINVVSFLLMCFDKWHAKKGLRRISEKTLFIAALCFGSVGIYLGMRSPVSHKSSKPNFRVGIPVCFILNLFSFYFMEKYVLHILM